MCHATPSSTGAVDSRTHTYNVFQPPGCQQTLYRALECGSTLTRGEKTGPNEPQTAAGRWGASASYNCPALLLLFSLSSSPSFLVALRHFSHSSPVAKTTACYLRSDQHEPEGFTFNCYRCDPSFFFLFFPTGAERLSLNEGRKQLLL